MVAVDQRIEIRAIDLSRSDADDAAPRGDGAVGPLACTGAQLDFARRIADQVIFMADGWVVEQGPPEQVLLAPREARTQAFLSGVSSWPRPSTNGASDEDSASR